MAIRAIPVFEEYFIKK